MTERPKNIRLATPADEEKIIQLMDEAFVEQPVFPLSKSKMREKIKVCTTREGGFIALAEGENGEVEGYIAVVLGSYWYTDAWHLEELSNFVSPEHRKGTHHARNLMEFAKWFAETMELPILFGILSTQRLEAKIRLYQRQAKMAGAIFVHNTGHIDGLLSEMG